MTDKAATRDLEGTTDVLKILYDRYFAGRPEMQKLLEEETLKMTVGQEIYGMRTDRGLTQRELADLIGADEKTIDDLEEADYEGDSLVYLQRIASALGKVVRIFIDDKENAATLDEQT